VSTAIWSKHGHSDENNENGKILQQQQLDFVFYFKILNIRTDEIFMGKSYIYNCYSTRTSTSCRVSCQWQNAVRGSRWLRYALCYRALCLLKMNSRTGLTARWCKKEHAANDQQRWCHCSHCSTVVVCRRTIVASLATYSTHRTSIGHRNPQTSVRYRVAIPLFLQWTQNVVSSSR